MKWCNVTGIEVKGQHSAANLSSCVISDCGAEPAHFLHSRALLVHEHASANLSHCTLQRSHQGLHALNASATAAECEFEHCTQCAVRVESRAGHAMMNMSACRVSDVPEGFGLRVSGFGAVAKADACTFLTCGITGVMRIILLCLSIRLLLILSCCQTTLKYFQC